MECDPGRGISRPLDGLAERPECVVEPALALVELA